MADIDTCDKSAALVTKEKSQMELAISELQEVTENFEHLIGELQSKLEPVLLEAAKPSPEAEIGPPETCAIGREIRHVASRLRQLKAACSAIYQNLDL